MYLFILKKTSFFIFVILLFNFLSFKVAPLPTKKVFLNMRIPAVEISNVSVAYHNKVVLWNVSCTIEQGTMVAIIGPNGAGKSTLLKAMLGMVSPIAGTINLLGTQYKKSLPNIAYVPQRALVDWDFPLTVLDVVLMGTYQSLGWFARPGKKEYMAAYHALDAVGMHDYLHQPIGQLSGGQQQRVFVARALVQNAQMYMLDEPFIGIDKTTEQIISSLLKQEQEKGKTILVVHHDLHTVASYFNAALLINKSAIAYGPLETSFTPENVQKTFNYASPSSFAGYHL